MCSLEGHLLYRMHRIYWARRLWVGRERKKRSRMVVVRQAKPGHNARTCQEAVEASEVLFYCEKWCTRLSNMLPAITSSNAIREVRTFVIGLREVPCMNAGCELQLPPRAFSAETRKLVGGRDALALILH